MNERVMDIVDRLRGIYIIDVNDGAGLLNGSNRHITHAKDHNSDWFQPPIQEEAAKEIEKLRLLTSQLEEALRQCLIDYEEKILNNSK